MCRRVENHELGEWFKVMNDYKMSVVHANALTGLACLPDEFRIKLLTQLQQEYGTDVLIQLFSAFIGLSNSVVANTRELIEMYLQIECNHSDRMAAKINLPTIFGALRGVATAIPPTKAMCTGCAFRLGTAANQSPVTTLDAQYCRDDSLKFMCHEDLDEKGEPTKQCAGYARAHAEQLAR